MSNANTSTTLPTATVICVSCDEYPAESAEDLCSSCYRSFNGIALPDEALLGLVEVRER